jgi:DNA-binding MarR family transcriptional regulator
MSDTVTSERQLADTVISVATHVEAELEETLAEHRLSRPSFLVLDALERAQAQTLNQRDLVNALRRTSGTLSVRLGRLERARLITREPDPENRRSVTVTLTERAARLAAGLPDGAAGPFGEALSAWHAFFEPGEGEHRRLGVAVAGAAVAKKMRRAVGLDEEPGLLIVRVKSGSAADSAGLSQGDLITAAAGSPVRSVGDLERAVRAADGTMALSVLRGVDTRQVKVALS